MLLLLLRIESLSFLLGGSHPLSLLRPPHLLLRAVDTLDPFADAARAGRLFAGTFEFFEPALIAGCAQFGVGL